MRGENFCACAARKFSTTVLPEPDGPMIVKLPRSPSWKLKKNGVDAGRLEHRDRLAPVIAARAAHREAVKRDEPRRVGARDQRAADDILLVAGELAPERGLEIDVLAHRDRADVGQRGGRIRGRALERLDRAAAHQHG